MTSTQPFGTLHEDYWDDEQILFGSLRFSLRTGEEIFEQAPEELFNNRDYEPEAPDVSTVPTSTIDSHPVYEGTPSRPRVNLPVSSQQQSVPDTSHGPEDSKGEQTEAVSDTVPTPVVPQAKWQPEKDITSKGDYEYYLGVLRKVKTYIIGGKNINIKVSEDAYKAEIIAADIASRRHVVFFAILQHVVGNFPKFCNPNIPAGIAASNRIVNVIKYLTSDEFETKTMVKIELKDINEALSAFCKYAYPDPQRGEERVHKVSRLKFICFNAFAIGLANRKLLDSLDVPKRAISAMMGQKEIFQSPCFNHESVFIVSKWLTTNLVDKLMEDDETKLKIPDIYGAISRYRPRYMELYKQDRKQEFLHYSIAIATAQAKIESSNKTYSNAEEKAQIFKTVTELALKQVEQGYDHPLANMLKEIAHLNEAARNQPDEGERQEVLLKLMTMVELCDQSLKTLLQRKST
ncbi:hypothetical protein F5B20DRAFT_65801 [Whalleya microplaca]|nr:hypothetical protein F5B20DRAFT_65801 [Whalleya microplaca]